MKVTVEEMKKYDEFAEAAYLTKKHDPWFRKREKEAIYAMVEISDCPEGCHYWYEPFVGMKFMAQLRFRDWGFGRELYEVVAVRLVNSFVHTGRTVGSENIRIL